MPPKKKKHVNRTIKASDKELVFRDEEETMYGVAVAVLGDRRFHVVLDVPDTTEYRLVVGRLRGNMRRSDRVMCGTHVLCSGRFDAAERKVDILHRYVDAHEKLLRRYGEFAALDVKYRRYQVDTQPGGPDPTPLDEDDGALVVFEATEEEDVDLI